MSFNANDWVPMKAPRKRGFAALCEKHGVYEKMRTDEDGNRYIILDTGLHLEGLEKWVEKNNIELPTIWESLPNESHKDFARRLGWIE